LRLRAGWCGPGPTGCLVLLTAAALLAAMLCGGCGQSTDPHAKKMVEEANDHLSKAAAEIKSLTGFEEQWSSLFKGQVSKEIATKVRLLLEKAKASEQKALDETKEALGLMQEAEKLPMAQNVKKYVALRRQGVEEQVLFLSAELEAMNLRIKAIVGQEAGESLEDLFARYKQVNVIEVESKEHAQKAGQFYKEADDYYKESGLGK
jgi:hypothetical protein